MATEQQIAANRENAQKSTGPQTPEGRAAVRLNGVKHGLSAATLILPGEDAADFDTLLEALEDEHQPATPTEVILVRQIAMAAWRQLRLYRMEAGFFRSEHNAHAHKDRYQKMDPDGRLAFIADCDAVNENALVNFHRFEVRLERSMRTALQELRRCRAERLAKSANQTQSEPAPRPKIYPGPQIVELKPSQPAVQPPEPSPDSGSDDESR